MSIIRILCTDEHLHEVDATVFGQWAAHEGIDGACEPCGSFVVTLVPSGRMLHSITGDLSCIDAIRIAHALSEEVPRIEDWRAVPTSVKEAIIKTVDDYQKSNP